MNTEGEFTRGTTSVLLPGKAASGYIHILYAVTGAPGAPTSHNGVGIAAPEGNSERSPDRLAPTGGSLYRGTIFLLSLLHRMAIIVRTFFSVKGKTREKQYCVDKELENDIMTAFRRNKDAGGAGNG